MQKKYLIRLFWSVFLLFVAACDQTQHKTDSMLRLEEAHQQVQILVDKGNMLLNAKVLAAPKQHLDTLVLAKKISNDAAAVFDQRNIRDWQHDELAKLQATIITLQPELAEYALDLLLQTTEKTIILRERLEEIKNVPYGAKGVDVDKMVGYLSKKYNADVLKCCLIDLTRINELLVLSPNKYESILKISSRIYSELEQIVRSEEAGTQMLERLENMRVTHLYF
ncbi:MAG: hypothetical protein ACI88A_004445 [Paraglaciecola sp.]